MGKIDTQFEVIEVKSNGVKNYFLEGFVSTTDPDLVNDIVTEEGQEVIINQMNGRNITVDDDHESYRDNTSGKLYDRTNHTIPLALIERAESRKTKKGSIGTWVRAKLNKDYPLFKEYLNSIKNGFVHSFSIAYKAINPDFQIIDGVKHRIISNLNIRNVGATGNPINDDSNFTLELKSFNKKMEDNKKIEQLETANADLKSSVETLTAEKATLEESLTQLKSEHKDYKANAEESDEKKKKKEEEEKKNKDNTEMKSLDKISVLEKQVAELKSFVESPQLKSIVEAKSKAPAGNSQKTTAWDVMA